MKIGIPKETKPLEGRVALVPEACSELVRDGHRLFMEKGAGQKSGFSDAGYANAGVTLLDAAQDVFAEAELVLKVKEPVGPEIQWLRPDHLLFCFLHLAANRPLLQALCETGLTALAFETVQDGGRLPLLAPMSDIAGRLAVQIGTHLLHQPAGGKGILLGGLPGVKRGRVVVIGGGVAGGNAARVAAALGAEVTVFDKDPVKLAQMRSLGANVSALYAYRDSVEDALRRADLTVGAVLVPGARTPVLVPESLVREMEAGSVIVDISVDQGGCVETTRPTSYEAPTYVVHGVTHFTVTNMPGAVPRSASRALSANLLPYVEKLAAGGWEEDPALRAGVNVRDHLVVHPALVAEAEAG